MANISPFIVCMCAFDCPGIALLDVEIQNLSISDGADVDLMINLRIMNKGVTIDTSPGGLEEVVLYAYVRTDTSLPATDGSVAPFYTLVPSVRLSDGFKTSDFGTGEHRWYRDVVLANVSFPTDRCLGERCFLYIYICVQQSVYIYIYT